jgi:hypothetical protein
MGGAVVPRPPEHQSDINPITLPAPARRTHVFSPKNEDKFVEKIGYIPISVINLFIQENLPAVCTASHNSLDHVSLLQNVHFGSFAKNYAKFDLSPNGMSSFFAAAYYLGCASLQIRQSSAD